MNPKRKMTLGFVLLGLSFVCIATWMSLPFSHFDTKTKVIGITTAVIMGKVTFFAATYFLGKPLIEKYKDRLMFWKKRPPQ